MIICNIISLLWNQYSKLLELHRTPSGVRFFTRNEASRKESARQIGEWRVDWNPLRELLCRHPEGILPMGGSF